MMNLPISEERSVNVIFLRTCCLPLDHPSDRAVPPTVPSY